MKITIDYDNKTIEVHSCENLLQLMNHLGRALPNGEWETYKLLNSVQIVEKTTYVGNQNYEILPTPGYNEPYTVQPWTPIGPIYSSGTSIADFKAKVMNDITADIYKLGNNVNDPLTKIGSIIN